MGRQHEDDITEVTAKSPERAVSPVHAYKDQGLAFLLY